jgi:hypothetical protein
VSSDLISTPSFLAQTGVPQVAAEQSKGAVFHDSKAQSDLDSAEVIKLVFVEDDVFEVQDGVLRSQPLHWDLLVCGRKQVVLAELVVDDG